VSTPGDFRRRARRQASPPREVKEQRFDSPLEQAIARKLQRLASEEAPHDADARAISFLVVKHWGDDAPRVMKLASEYVRDEVGRWTPKPPETAPDGGAGTEPPGDKS
jgi:hypothetical protein